MDNIAANGGFINLNFIFTIVKQAFFGRDWCCMHDSAGDQAKTFVKRDSSSGSDSGPQVAAHKFQCSLRYGSIRQQLVEMIINLEVSDISFSDPESGSGRNHKPIYQFEKDKQTLLESQFIFWKFLALVKYSELDLDVMTFTDSIIGGKGGLDKSGQP